MKIRPSHDCVVSRIASGKATPGGTVIHSTA